MAGRYAGKIAVVPGLLAPAYMAIALPQAGSLKRPIDRALIKITSGPEREAIEERFFAP